ncbi:hypothetical protein AAVH_29605, partial [Aphelenchoides avenae]
VRVLQLACKDNPEWPSIFTAIQSFVNSGAAAAGQPLPGPVKWGTIRRETVQALADDLWDAIVELSQATATGGWQSDFEQY